MSEKSIKEREAMQLHNTLRERVQGAETRWRGNTGGGGGGGVQARGAGPVARALRRCLKKKAPRAGPPSTLASIYTGLHQPIHRPPSMHWPPSALISI
jgi:hypothetical protein